MDLHVDTFSPPDALPHDNARRSQQRSALRSNSTTVRAESTSSNKSVIVAVTNGAPAMADEIDKEFASHREMFPTEEDKKAFDQLVKQLLEKHGVDYVRGYVDALKDMQKRKAS